MVAEQEQETTVAIVEKLSHLADGLTELLSTSIKISERLSDVTLQMAMVLSRSDVGSEEYRRAALHSLATYANLTRQFDIPLPKGINLPQ